MLVKGLLFHIEDYDDVAGNSDVPDDISEAFQKIEGSDMRVACLNCNQTSFHRLRYPIQRAGYIWGTKIEIRNSLKDDIFWVSTEGPFGGSSWPEVDKKDAKLEK